MNNLISSPIESYLELSKLKPTYCNEIAGILSRGIIDTRFKLVEFYYTHNSLVLSILDKENNQSYSINIKADNQDK